MAGQNERIAALEEQVIRFATRLAPPGWKRIDLHCIATVAVSDIALTVLGEDKKIATAESVPSELTDLLMDLRRACYLSEQGTWFSVLFLIEPGAAPSEIQRLYNYDFDPEWNPPIPLDCWRRDQIVLPRDGAYTPHWLRSRLEDVEPSYSGEPGDPVPLNPVEQMELISNELNIVLADHAPPLWQRIFGYYQAVGDNVQYPPMMCYKADGTMSVWAPPAAAGVVIDRLRAGMYGFQGSTWSRMDFQLTFENNKVRCQAKYTWDEEPAFQPEPSAEDVRRELERFPRDNPPEWMARRLGTSAAPSPPTTPDAPKSSTSESASVQAPASGSAPAPASGSASASASGSGSAPASASASGAAPAPASASWPTPGATSGSGSASASRAEAAPAPEGIRKARVFDNVNPDSDRPSVSRPPVPQNEVARVIDYLRHAPVVMAARSYAPDRLDPSRGSQVPLTFHTDGTWVWSGAVAYYLREHGISPEPDLVAHIRAQGFHVPTVDDDTMNAASAAVTGTAAPDRLAQTQAASPPSGAFPAPSATPAAPASPSASPMPAAPPAPPASSAPVASPTPSDSRTPPPPASPPAGTPSGTAGSALPPPGPTPPPAAAPPAAATVFEPAAHPAPATMFEQPPQPEPRPAPPTLLESPDPAQASAPSPDSGPDRNLEVRPASPAAVLRELEKRLKDLSVDPAVYRLQEAVEGAWCMVYEDKRWSVFHLYDGERRLESAFDTAGKAAAYLLGSLLLVPERMKAAEFPAEEEAIQPLTGEPPLSLFRNRQVIELPAGARVDRYGGPSGNVVYVARTPFHQRSLPADWESRPYYTYRLLTPLRVLTGTAVPWFEQPGGGTAYILPRAIADHLADGTLTEDR
ncbi:TNT domain-containing protein [Actinomadura barringtoniae]|uniref:TNT domain-containing protein n=1 Tax=Actinomadura barringtoniae TaxID=1427535 RepID=A0A939PQT9_9ACTN|nr:TNT domain-containing protein [Actinomadura barringtoniae]MBO2454548.1 TNT domain-containing protein [Actinomadura barringtoniae]